jgi:hypothetical protein
MNIFNEDFKDFITYLNQNEVEYVRVIHLQNFIEAKKAAGRSKDLNDLENLPSE